MQEISGQELDKEENADDNDVSDWSQYENDIDDDRNEKVTNDNSGVIMSDMSIYKALGSDFYLAAKSGEDFPSVSPPLPSLLILSDVSTTSL